MMVSPPRAVARQWRLRVPGQIDPCCAQMTDPGALNAKAKNAATPRKANATR